VGRFLVPPFNTNAFTIGLPDQQAEPRWCSRFKADKTFDR
jgi:hypothetical protein